MTIKSSATVRCLQWGFATCKTSEILGDNAACTVPDSWVSSGVLGTFFVFGIPSMVWPPVQQKLSAEAMGQDIKLSGEGAIGVYEPALGDVSWLWAMF